MKYLYKTDAPGIEFNKTVNWTNHKSSHDSEFFFQIFFNLSES